MRSLLEKLFDEVRHTGWAIGESVWFSQPNSSNHSLLSWIETHGFQPLKNRPSEGFVSELRPQSRKAAHPLSLSATTGLSEQPMHTDGAHLRDTPDFVLLWSEKKNATSTRVWKPNLIPRAAQNGVFVVYNGKERWLTQGHSLGKIRFDPGCMSPADQSAMELSRILIAPPEEEVEHIHWDSEGKIVIIDNRRVLHGRSSISEGDEGRSLKRLAVKSK